MTEIISGVYEIRNNLNGHRYIGSAVDVFHRWRTHKSLLNRGRHGNPHLQSAWTLYGANSFELAVIENCDKDQLISREQFYIDALHPEYNIRTTAQSNFGLKSSLETRAKLSILGKNMSQEVRDKISRSSIGRRHSELSRLKMSIVARNRTKEYKDKLSSALIGNQNALGATRSLETRAKMTEAQRNKSKEHRERISAAKIGHEVTPETRQKISNAQIGRKHSEETRLKMSLAHKGKKYKKRGTKA